MATHVVLRSWRGSLEGPSIVNLPAGERIDPNAYGMTADEMLAAGVALIEYQVDQQPALDAFFELGGAERTDLVALYHAFGVFQDGNTPGGEANELVDLGTVDDGEGLAGPKVGVNLQVRRINGEGLISVAESANGNALDITTTAEANSLGSLGAGETLVGAQAGSVLNTKSLVAGTNVSFTADAQTVTINATQADPNPRSNEAVVRVEAGVTEDPDELLFNTVANALAWRVANDVRYLRISLSASTPGAQYTIPDSPGYDMSNVIIGPRHGEPAQGVVIPDTATLNNLAGFENISVFPNNWTANRVNVGAIYSQRNVTWGFQGAVAATTPRLSVGTEAVAAGMVRVQLDGLNFESFATDAVLFNEDTTPVFFQVSSGGNVPENSLVGSATFGIFDTGGATPGDVTWNPFNQPRATGTTNFRADQNDRQHSYDNADSGLTATTTKTALDELAARPSADERLRFDVAQAGHGFTVVSGIPVPAFYNSDTSSWVAADLSGGDTPRVRTAYVVAVADADNFTLQMPAGIVDLTPGHGLVDGDFYFSDTSSPFYTVTEPTSGIVQPLWQVSGDRLVLSSDGARSATVETQFLPTVDYITNFQAGFTDPTRGAYRAPVASADTLCTGAATFTASVLVRFRREAGSYVLAQRWQPDAGNSLTAGSGWYIAWNGGILTFGISDGTDAVRTVQVTSPDIINRWTVISGVWDTSIPGVSSQRIYLNGSLAVDDEQAFSGFTAAGTGRLFTVGAGETSDGDLFQPSQFVDIAGFGYGAVGRADGRFPGHSDACLYAGDMVNLTDGTFDNLYSVKQETPGATWTATLGGVALEEFGETVDQAARTLPQWY